MPREEGGSTRGRAVVSLDWRLRHNSGFSGHCLSPEKGATVSLVMNSNHQGKAELLLHRRVDL